MKKSIFICTAIASLVMMIYLLTEGNIVFATETKATVKIKFTGDEKDKAGFAQSQITVTPDKAHNGYYLVYYTDGKNVLPDYDEAVAIRANGSNPVKGSIGDGIMLPVNAKGIAVFECETYFTDKTPDISQAIATAQIPESKQLSSFGSLEFTFGALSDTHMNYEQHSRGAYAKLRYAMDFYAEKKHGYCINSRGCNWRSWRISRFRSTI